MKKILLFFMLLSATSAFAQDVIVKKDGSTILSRVIKITTTEVEYKKFSNLNGPTYTIAKTELQAINYENGEKETFGQQESSNSSQLVQSFPTYTTTNRQKQWSDRDLYRLTTGNTDYAKKAKRLRIVGWTIGPAFFIAGGAVMGSFIDSEIGIVGIVMLTGGIATTTACLIRAHKLMNMSIYSLNTAPLYQQKITFGNGTSLATGVDVIRDNQLNNNPTLGLGVRYNF